VGILFYDIYILVVYVWVICVEFECCGVCWIVVVFSYWYFDYVVGIEVFVDCEVIVNECMVELLVGYWIEIEVGISLGLLLIDLFVLLMWMFICCEWIEVGLVEVELIYVEIYSDDVIVFWLFD